MLFLDELLIKKYGGHKDQLSKNTIGIYGLDFNDYKDAFSHSFIDGSTLVNRQKKDGTI